LLRIQCSIGAPGRPGRAAIAAEPVTLKGVIMDKESAPEGGEKALAAIKASKKLVDFEAEVTGEVTGNTIKVKSLKLIEE
jgi:hypothetical protein